MQPRFVGRLSVADVVTVANAVLGFAATVTAVAVSPSLAARLVLLGAIADGLDGVLARRYGSSAAGSMLDSLADVSTFVVAPAVITVSLTRALWGADPERFAVAVAAGGLFVGAGVLRLGMYAAFDADAHSTEGVPTTLAATLLAALTLANVTAVGTTIGGVAGPTIAVAVTVALAGAMLAPITYPDLLAGDALILGVVQAFAVLAPTALDGAFPLALLLCALAYLLLSPQFYWREA